jgi:2,4-dienoyl-CoA reductase-like NADH-dependent reductase (Old Yellow Enzyme family)
VKAVLLVKGRSKLLPVRGRRAEDTNARDVSNVGQGREESFRFELKSRLRAAFQGLFILAGGFDRARAVRALEAGAADLIALPARSLPNPDLVPRMRADATLNAAIATDLKSDRGSTGRLHSRM